MKQTKNYIERARKSVSARQQHLLRTPWMMIMMMIAVETNAWHEPRFGSKVSYAHDTRSIVYNTRANKKKNLNYELYRASLSASSKRGTKERKRSYNGAYGHLDRENTQIKTEKNGFPREVPRAVNMLIKKQAK